MGNNQDALEGLETLVHGYAMREDLQPTYAEAMQVGEAVLKALQQPANQQAEIERLRKENAELVDILRECLGHLTGGMDGKWSEEFDVIVEIKTALAKHEGKE